MSIMTNPSTIAELHQDILQLSQFQQEHPGELVSSLWATVHFSGTARAGVKSFRGESPQSWVHEQTDPTFLVRVLLSLLWAHTYPGSPRWGATP